MFCIDGYVRTSDVYLVMQGLLLPALLKVMPEKWVLVVAMSCSVLDMLGLSSAPYMGGWVVYAGLVIGAPSNMALPVISALKSVHAGEDEQGKVQVWQCDGQLSTTLIISSVILGGILTAAGTVFGVSMSSYVRG